MHWFTHTPNEAALPTPPHLPMSLGADIRAHWLPVQAIKPTLLRALQAWSGGQIGNSIQELAAIRHEVWLADNALQSLPMIAMAAANPATPLGFLSGYPRYDHDCFYISETALYPCFQDSSEEGIVIAISLVEAAMDESQRMGCHGWVACAPVAERIHFWRQLGFSRFDDFTYRRMGYF